MSVLDLARPELRTLRPYQPGAYEPDTIRLNSNESPYRLPSDTTERGLNYYPPPRPVLLQVALAAHYGAPQNEVLVTRGSSEAIDVLIRGFCRAGQDEILICPPTFDMYRVYATIQGAGIKSVPLLGDQGFAVDTDAVLAGVSAATKIVFLCTPNNPTGAAIPRSTIDEICAAIAGRALVVIDEAYYEFSSEADCIDLRARYENVVLLRTLSKFVSLAGARCGALIAAPALIEFAQNVLPPYTFPTPSIEIVTAAMAASSLAVAEERISLIRRERARLSKSLNDLPDVVEVYPSNANFILIRVRNRDAVVDSARRAGILLRKFDGEPTLRNCIRITIGRPEDNDRLLQAISTKDPRHDS
jgi:histidinol-phosphate aminotransferase